MPFNTAFTLYDLSGDLNADNEFRDSEAHPAYYCQSVRRDPISTKIIRMPVADWPTQPVATSREPWSAWLYFTSSSAMEGYIKIGSNEPTSMANHLRSSGGTSK